MLTTDKWIAQVIHFYGYKYEIVRINNGLKKSSIRKRVLDLSYKLITCRDNIRFHGLKSRIHQQRKMPFSYALSLFAQY